MTFSLCAREATKFNGKALDLTIGHKGFAVLFFSLMPEFAIDDAWQS